MFSLDLNALTVNSESHGDTWFTLRTVTRDILTISEEKLYLQYQSFYESIAPHAVLLS